MTLRREQKSPRIIIGDQKLVNAVWSRCKQTVSLSRVKLREKYRLNWSLLNQCCFFVGVAWEIIIQTATGQSINDSCQQQKILELKLRKKLRKQWSLEECAKPSSINYSCQFKTRLAKQKCIEHSFNFYLPSSFDAWHSEQFNDGPFGSRSFWSGQNDNSLLLKPSWGWEMGDCSNIVCQCQRNCGVGCYTPPYQSHAPNLKSPPAVI